MTDHTPLTDDQRRLVEQNLDLAHHLALSAWRGKGHLMDKEETVAVAYEALVMSARRFDPSRANVVDGVADVAGAFAGFARRRINGAIIDWQRREDHVPRRHRTVYKELQSLGLGSGRTLDELSALTGMPVDRLSSIVRAVESMPISLSATFNSSSGFSPLSGAVSVSHWMDDEVAESGGVEETALEARIRHAVVDVFDNLTQQQRVVIALRYYEGMDLPGVAQALEMSVTTVRQLHADALLEIHAAMVHEAT